jgi:hypothetical protein
MASATPLRAYFLFESHCSFVQTNFPTPLFAPACDISPQGVRDAITGHEESKARRSRRPDSR